jgi:hypothetical protein
MQTWLFDGDAPVPWPGASNGAFLSPSFLSDLDRLAQVLRTKGLLKHLVAACDMVTGRHPREDEQPAPARVNSENQMQDAPEKSQGHAPEAQSSGCKPNLGAADAVETDDASAAALLETGRANVANIDLFTWYHGVSRSTLQVPAWARLPAAAVHADTARRCCADPNSGADIAGADAHVQAPEAACVPRSLFKSPTQKAPNRQRRQATREAVAVEPRLDRGEEHRAKRPAPGRQDHQHAKRLATGHAVQENKRKRCGKMARALSKGGQGQQEGVTEMGFFAKIKQYEVERRANGLFDNRNSGRQLEAFAVQQLAL